MSYAKGRPAVYCIKNIVNKKLYVGSSCNYPERWNQHRKSLRAGKHYNKHLQSSWKKYGESAFVFGILEECQVSHIPSVEMRFIKELEATNPKRGYNYYDVYRGGKRKRPVYQYSMDGKFIREWDTVGSVPDIKPSGIVVACRKKTHSGGFQWRYVTDSTPDNIGPFTKKKKHILGIYGFNMSDYTVVGPWPTLSEAASSLSVDDSTILKVLSRRIFHWKKLIFVYASSEDNAKDIGHDIASTYTTYDPTKNLARGIKVSAEKRKRPVKRTGPGEVIVFDSIKSAAASISKIPSTVLSVIKGKTKTAGGFTWEYA